MVLSEVILAAVWRNNDKKEVKREREERRKEGREGGVLASRSKHTTAPMAVVPKCQALN